MQLPMQYISWRMLFFEKLNIKIPEIDETTFTKFYYSKPYG